MKNPEKRIINSDTIKENLAKLGRCEDDAIEKCCVVVDHLLKRDFGAIRATALSQPDLRAKVDVSLEIQFGGKTPSITGASTVVLARHSSASLDLGKKKNGRHRPIDLD